MTPLEQAVEAVEKVIRHGDGKHTVARGAVLAALDVLGPVLLQEARAFDRDVSRKVIRVGLRHPDWPSLRDAITQEPPR